MLLITLKFDWLLCNNDLPFLFHQFCNFILFHRVVVCGYAVSGSSDQTRFTFGVGWVIPLPTKQGKTTGTHETLGMTCFIMQGYYFKGGVKMLNNFKDL